MSPQDEGMAEMQSLIRLHKFSCQTQESNTYWSVVKHSVVSSDYSCLKTCQVGKDNVSEGPVSTRLMISVSQHVASV